MGIVSQLLAPRYAARNAIDDYWYTPLGQTAASGARVTAETAMTLSAVWACVNLISRNVASLPLVTYRYVGDEGRARARNHPLYTLLHDRPNRLQTPYEFKQFLQVSLLLRGNAYAVPIPSQTSPIDELIPLHPDRVREEQYDTDRRGPSGLIVPGTRYRYRQPSGQEIVLSDDDVIHLKGLSLDGIRGVSIIEYARETFGLAAAEREYAARFFGSGSQARGILRVKGKLSPGAVARVKADWELMHQGLANAHRVAVLEEGVEFQPISLSPEDSQFLESRAHERGEIASWFSVPPHMIGDTDKSSSWGTGIQQQQVAFLVFTLRPWLKVWEEAIKRDLILQPNTFFVQFVVEELLRGDVETRYRAYAQGRQWGWLSVNEIRRMENMDPIPNGDIYLQASNMVEAGQVAAESSDKETWTLNERRVADGLEPIPGGDAVYMPSSMIPAIELEESEEAEEEAAESEVEGTE